jgi:hypothetical protein
MVRILCGYSHPSSSFYLVNLMPLYLRDPFSLLHPPAPRAPPSDNPFEPLDTAYDPNKSDLPYQMVYTTSETNPESLLHVFENIHSNTIATSSCHSVAMTFILDTPLLIRFHLQEPPPPSPVPSHPGSSPTFLTGVGLRSSSATPLRYPSNLRLTMWFGANTAVGVE